jgi:predicted outer membrane repeat protein
MKYKKSIIFIFLVICFLSIAGVCASDAGDVNIQAGNDTIDDVVALDVDSQENDDAVASQDVVIQENYDVVASQEEISQDTVAVNDADDKLSSNNTLSFEALQGFLTHNQSKLDLYQDFLMKYGDTTIKIKKNITIEGNGHTLNGDNRHRLFSIEEDGLNITFRNIIFKNGGAMEDTYSDDRGGVILNPHPHSVINIINCEFRHNGVSVAGGAIYTNGDLTILDSKFYKNVAMSGNGGAIFCRGNLLINNAEFEGNEVQKTDSVLDLVFQLLGEKYYYYGEYHKGPDSPNVENPEQLIHEYKVVAQIYKLYSSSKIDEKEVMRRLHELYPDSLFSDSPKDFLPLLLKDIESRIKKAQYFSDAPMSGGAIFCQGECRVTNSSFMNNIVGIDNQELGTSGGAIHCKSNIYVNNSTFVGNSVNDWGGGAIFVEKNCYIYGSKFEDNTANKGCAIYCWEETNVYDSEFSYNHHIEDTTWLEKQDPIGELIKTLASDVPVLGSIVSHLDLGTKIFYPSEGGAIWSGGKCLIDSCIFDNNQVMEHGGAIYAHSDLTITGQDNLFHHNRVSRAYWGGFYKDGGAIYCCGNLFINNTQFDYNTASTDGGAIFCENNCNIYNSIFEDNVATWTDLFKLESCYGGAINTVALGEVNNCSFIRNTAGTIQSSYKGLYSKAGAIYVKGDCSPKLISCHFQKNAAVYEGGAICIESSNTNSNVISCKFDSNHVILFGGAIYSGGKSTIKSSSFDNNYVNGELDSRHGSGGAIYSESNLILEYSNFTKNKAHDNGGAAYSPDMRVKNCVFNKSKAKMGGALYVCDNSYVYSISNSTFAYNSADSGGAIYLKILQSLTDCKFIGNEATGGDGGAMHVEDCFSMTNNVFEDNSASNYGGGIYASGEVIGHACLFNRNSAKSGGAIYSAIIANNARITDSIFTNNKATDGDGGAIYSLNDPSGDNDIKSEILSCRFEGNTATNCGGAIYLCAPVRLYHINFKIWYCTFIDNHASQKDYSPSKLLAYRTPGHSIFYCGGTMTFQDFWLGTNNPNYKGQFGEKNWYGDSEAEPSYFKIGINLNETEIYEGNVYKATIYLDRGRVHNLLHSDGKFWGDANFSNFKLGDRNEMTADVIFTEGTHKIYGQLDHQEVSLEVNAKVKGPSEVHIISCDDIKYPNQLNVTYKILNMSDNPSFVIKDSHGEIVKQGNLTNQSTLLVGNLTPGSYSITINNPESRRYLASSANATFNVSRGDIGLMIVVFNETYPDDVEAIVHASEDGKYVISVDTRSWDVIVKNNVSHFNMGVLDAGNYTATISFAGDDLYSPFSNTTKFTVSREGTSFEIEVVPGEIAYGESAKVIHIFGDGVNGTIIYHLHNGTFIAELPACENLTLPVLNVGSYVIIANYSGDRDHEPAFDSAHITIHKAQPEFRLEANPIRYGDNATVAHILPSDASGFIKYCWGNGTFICKLPANENLILPVLLDVGSYVIIAEYSGDKNLFNATANATLVVNKAETGIIAFPVITTYKDDDYLLIELKDINGNSITGVNVTVDLNGAKNYTTDENGQIKIFTSNLGANTYDVYVSFNGTDNYLNSSAFTNVFVNTRPSVMVTTSLITTYQIHKYLMVNLKDDMGRPISGVEVFTVIHGVSYKATTDSNGDGRLIIRLDPMDYVATIVFDNDNYTISMETARVLVYKADPKIIAKSKKFKARKKVKKYTITLKDNIGKVIKNAKVTLKIKGKTYTAKTNSKGKATFKIKKLTKKGKFKATLTFNGNYLFNKVTKKVKIVCSK